MSLNDPSSIDRATQLERQVRRRNRLEIWLGGGAAILLAVAGIATLRMAATPAAVLQGTGFLLLVAGIACVLWQIWRQASAPGDRTRSLLARLRHEEALLRTAWLWYVGPFVPGLLLIHAAMLLRRGPEALPLIAAVATLALLVGIVLLNRRAAAALRREIAAIETGGSP